MSRAPELVISHDLKLPISAVTEKIAFIGRTGGGKTYAAMKLAEEMLKAGAQIVAIDPVGKWYGLRIEGRGPGFPVPVFGGQHGDYPLTAASGRLVADLIVDRRLSAVLDVSDFMVDDLIRFSTDFAMQFFQRKKSKQSPVHFFIEECQEIVPQTLADRGSNEMVQAWQRIWKIGRNYGIGGSLISQRPQEISKRVLNQTGTLFVFGMTAPHERKVIEGWVADNDIDDDIASILPKLMNGTPHVWSPGFLKVSKTVKVDPKQTADISSTPTHGDQDFEQPLTEIDGAAIRDRMAELIEEAESADPRALRKRISELQAECARLEISQRTVEKPVLTDDDRRVLTNLCDVFSVTRTEIETITNRLFLALGTPVGPSTDLRQFADSRSRPLDFAYVKMDSPVVAKQPTVHKGKKLDKCSLAVLQVLWRAQREQRLPGLPVKILALRAGYAYTGTMRTYLSSMRTMGLIEGANGELIRLTPDGAALVTPDPAYPYSTIEHWRSKLGAGERRILDALADRRHVHGLRMRELADAAGTGVTGTMRTYLSKLRSLGILEGANTGLMRLSPEIVIA